MPINTIICQMTGGGPLPDEVGDYLVARGVKIVSAYGGTEFAVGTLLHPNLASEKEWAWYEFTPTYPIRWVEHSDGKQTLYEPQVLVRFSPFSIHNITSLIYLAGY